MHGFQYPQPDVLLGRFHYNNDQDCNKIKQIIQHQTLYIPIHAAEIKKRKEMFWKSNISIKNSNSNNRDLFISLKWNIARRHVIHANSLDFLSQTSKLFTVTKASLNIIIIIIEFKGATRDFLQSPHCATNRLQHVRSSGLGVTVCKSCATCWALITCNMSCYMRRGTKGQLSY